MSRKQLWNTPTDTEQKHNSPLYAVTPSFRPVLEQRSDSPENERKAAPAKLSASKINFYYGSFQALHDVSLDFAEKQDNGIDRTIGLRKINFHSDSESHARDCSRRAVGRNDPLNG